MAQEIVSRSILIKEIIDVFSQSNGCYEKLVKNVDLERLQPVIDKKLPFRFLVEGIGKKISSTFQKELIEKFSELPFDKELVNLVDYKLVYKIIENGEDGEIFFGHQVAMCRPHESTKNKNHDDTFHSKYSLKKRPYLGPTSTDHELAFLMANQGQVRAGDFVYDPFVGTGSIATAL